MNLTRCKNGHFYDAEKYSCCPHCGYGASVGKIDTIIPITDPILVKGSDQNEEPFVFISYCHNDYDEVSKVLKLMERNRFRFWYDEGIKSGVEWADEIANRIKKCEQFVCFISKSTLMSENSKDEIHLANKYRSNIIVIYLEDVSLTGGLELQLDRKQAILKHKYSKDLFQKKFLESLSTKAIIPYNSSVLESDNELKKSYQNIQKLNDITSSNEVYLAENIRTNSNVIIKHGKFDDSVIGKSIKDSFMKEKEILSKNILPYIPALYDCFQDVENVYIVEEYIKGQDLTCLIFQDKFDIVNVMIEVAKILDTVHKNGYVHCDVNPKNIMISNDLCYLIDFGSAKSINESEQNQICMGTPGYAAPEQYGSYNGELDIYGTSVLNKTVIFTDTDTANDIDCRTDIYGLGKTLLSLLLGVYTTDRLSETSIALNDRDFKKDESFCGISDITLNDPLLEAIIDKMTREQKNERFRSMTEVVDVLSMYLKIKNI